MTQWQRIYLRAESEAVMMTALDAAGLVSSDSETGDQTIGDNPRIIRLKLLPNLAEPTGETLTDGEDFEYPEMAPVPGYHVNIFVHPDYEAEYRLALSDVLIDTAPETPIVDWAR